MKETRKPTGARAPAVPTAASSASITSNAGGKPDVWMPLLIDRFLGDTTHLDTQEKGAYLLLLMSAWKHAGRLPNDSHRLRQVTGLDPEPWARAEPALRGFFKASADGAWLTQKRLSIEFMSAERRAAAASLAGQKGAAKRWGQNGDPNGDPTGGGSGSGIASGNGADTGDASSAGNGAGNGDASSGKNGVAIPRIQGGEGDSGPDLHQDSAKNGVGITKRWPGQWLGDSSPPLPSTFNQAHAAEPQAQARALACEDGSGEPENDAPPDDTADGVDWPPPEPPPEPAATDAELDAAELEQQRRTAGAREDTGRTGQLLGVAVAALTTVATPARSPAGVACRAMIDAGINPLTVNASDPRLGALLEQGAKPDEFAGIAREAAGKGKGFAWVLTVLAARRSEARAIALAPDAPPPADDWTRSDRGVRGMARQLGVESRPDEGIDVYVRRVVNAWHKAGRPAPSNDEPPAAASAAAA